MAVKSGAGFKPSATQKQDLRTLARVAPEYGAKSSPLAHVAAEQLWHVERMAAHRMNLAQIGMRLRFDPEVWRGLIESNPAIREAYEAGVARAQDEITTALYENAKNGDVSAQRFWLERHGGPQWSKEKVPAVVIQPGANVSIDLGAVETAFSGQRVIEAEYEDLGDS